MFTINITHDSQRYQLQSTTTTKLDINQGINKVDKLNMEWGHKLRKNKNRSKVTVLYTVTLYTSIDMCFC